MREEIHEILDQNDKEINQILRSLKPEKEETLEDIENAFIVKAPIVRKGEVWKLGNHRLMCGDSTKEEQVKISEKGLVALKLLKKLQKLNQEKFKKE